MKPDHEALRLSDIFAVSSPVRRGGMFRGATDRTQHLRSKVISEAPRGIDDWVRQHAEATSAFTRGYGETRLPWSIFGSMAIPLLTPPRFLASQRQFWFDFRGPEINNDSNLRALQSLHQAAQVEEQLPTITLSMLDTALHASRRPLKGQDMLGAADLLALPDWGRQERAPGHGWCWAHRSC